MADQHSFEASSSTDVASDNSESTMVVNIKTLDSQMHTFHVDKSILVSAFKEKVASQTGVPLGQQRLIFRGKVLKDEHLLSDYHVESGSTLHLVVRQPSQQQSSSSATAGEVTANHGGQESNTGGPRNRVGQISHSVVLGTFNIGDQGEGVMPDLGRVIGAVLNSVGIGNQMSTVGPVSAQPLMQLNSVQSSQGNTTEVTGSNVGVQNSAGNQPLPREAFPSQSLPQVLQIPLGATIPIPSLNMPIPDSLNTLSMFMRHMEMALSQNGLQFEQSRSPGDVQPAELPTNALGLSTPEALTIVLRYACRLLGNQTIAALSHIAGRLEEDGNSTDPAVRGQIQIESAQVGIAMQHLGSLLLELGRTVLTLRMGQSPAESSVNAGPAVYISPSGPNPIMVQPFPLQTSSLFGGLAGTQNSGALAPGGAANVSRHINIHIHTAGPRTANGGEMQGGNVNGSNPTDLGQTSISLPRHAASGVPLQPVVVSAAGVARPGIGVSRLPDAVSVPLPEVNSQMRNLVDELTRENEASSGQQGSSTIQDHTVGLDIGNHDPNIPIKMEGNEVGESSDALPVANNQMMQAKGFQPSNDKDRNVSTSLKPAVDTDGARSDSDVNNPSSSSIPLGLGLGGLQPRKRNRHPSHEKNGDAPMPNAPANNNQQSRSVEQFDAAGMMSQVLHSPAIDGLLSGVSQQTGVGSPDVLRNMLCQLTQSPTVMNTVNQIAQQIDSQDLGSMFSGRSAGQGGGMDLSRMFQQMMPVVSQALGHGGSPVSQLNLDAEPEMLQSQDSQVGSLHVARSTGSRQNEPQDIFRSVVARAAHLSNNGDPEGFVDELCSDESLANEFLEMLHGDVSRRLQHEKDSAENP